MRKLARQEKVDPHDVPVASPLSPFCRLCSGVHLSAAVDGLRLRCWHGPLLWSSGGHVLVCLGMCSIRPGIPNYSEFPQGLSHGALLPGWLPVRASETRPGARRGASLGRTGMRLRTGLILMAYSKATRLGWETVQSLGDCTPQALRVLPWATPQPEEAPPEPQTRRCCKKTREAQSASGLGMHVVLPRSDLFLADFNSKICVPLSCSRHVPSPRSRPVLAPFSLLSLLSLSRSQGRRSGQLCRRGAWGAPRRGLEVKSKSHRAGR